MTTLDSIKMPKHYTGHPSGIEPKSFLGWFPHFVGCAMKYLWRAGLKDGNTVEQDLLKAREYIDFELERIRASKPTEVKLRHCVPAFEESWEGFKGRFEKARNRVSYRNRKGEVIFWAHHPADGLADAFKGLEALKAVCTDNGPVHLIGKKVRNSHSEHLVAGVYRYTGSGWSGHKYGDWCVQYNKNGSWDFASSVKLVEPRDPDLAPEGKCWTWGSGIYGYTSRKVADGHRSENSKPIRLENISRVSVVH